MKAGILLLLILFFSLTSHGLELTSIEFKQNAVLLKFRDQGENRSIEDNTGWITLRVLTLLAFQDAVERSYKNPDQTSKILKEEAPELRRLSKSFTKTILLLKDQSLSDEQKEFVESILDSDIFNFEKNRRRTTQEVLNNKLQPLLSLEPIKQMTEIEDGKKNEIPRHSLNPGDGIAFEISTSQINIPAKFKYRTKSRIEWNPQTLKIDGI